MTSVALGLVVGAVTMMAAGEARADCNPPCPSPQVCRYEAAGGHFYCADPPTGGGSNTGGRWTRANVTPRVPTGAPNSVQVPRHQRPR